MQSNAEKTTRQQNKALAKKYKQCYKLLFNPKKFFLSSIWTFVSFLLSTLLPGAVVFALATLSSPFVINTLKITVDRTDSLWGTATAIYGFSISVFLIIASKDKGLFGESSLRIYLSNIFSRWNFEAQFMIEATLYFFFGLFCVIVNDQATIVSSSIAIIIFSFCLFASTFSVLIKKQEKYWMQHLKRARGFRKKTYFSLKMSSFLFLLKNPFFWKVSRTIATSIIDEENYILQQLKKGESIYPEFDIYISTIKKTKDVLQEESDLFSIEYILPKWEMIIELLEKRNMDYQAKEAASTMADLFLSFDKNALSQQYDAILSDVSWERLQSLFEYRPHLKMKIKKMMFYRTFYLSMLRSIYLEIYAYLDSKSDIIDENRKTNIHHLCLKYQNSALSSISFRAFLANDKGIAEDLLKIMNNTMLVNRMW